MSPNAPDSNEPTPALSTPATPPPREFDLLAFWIQHQRLILRIIIVALLAVAVWGALLFMDYRKLVGSQDALSNAKTAADFRKVTADWPGTAAGGTATIRLAEELGKEGKAAEAVLALREFLDKYPVHPLRVPAAHALAASLETAGKFDEALTAYQQFGAAHGRSAFAPLAAIGQARVLMALNRNEEAQKALESVEQKFPGNPFVYDARTLLEEIKNAAGRKTGGSPRPTPAPAPASAPAPAPNLQGGTPAPRPPGAPVPSISITPSPAPAAPAVPPTPPAVPPTPPAAPATPPK
ncbi:MAG: tetratricopeptide repeat protein [Chthoniobacteraceae bacterium]